MRIVAGKYRARSLKAPEGEDTRPTSDRARQMIFNILDSRLIKQGRHWTEMTVLDAFAGTGALGLEAVSRGAKSVVFMEKSSVAMAVLRKNAVMAEKDGVSVRYFSDVMAPFTAEKPCELIFMDPPYQQNLVVPALQALHENAWMSSQTLCIVETEKNETPVFPDFLKIIDQRSCGKAKIWFLMCQND